MNSHSDQSTDDSDGYRRNDQRFVRPIFVVTIVVLLGAVCVVAFEMLLILFLAGPFGVFLFRVSDWLSGILPCGRTVCLAFVVGFLLLGAVGGTAVFIVQIDQQVRLAGDRVDEGVERLRELIRQYPVIGSTVRSIPLLSSALLSPNHEADEKKWDAGPSNGRNLPAPSADPGQRSTVNDDPLKTGTTDDTVAESSLSQLPEPVKRVVRSIGQVLQTTFGLAVNSLLIFFVGLFLAISPDAYRDGLIRLIPPVRRQRAGEVLEAMSRGVWRWLIGRFGSMLVTGIGAFLLLWLIGVPMAGTLGVITGLLTFVPNIGAAVALMLAILFALPQGLAAAGTVLAAYLALQMCESYIVTPLIQQEQVSLPPAIR
ncbi:MAG: AI-2E family transporter, partial [Planctomycetaceae bacterium]